MTRMMRDTFRSIVGHLRAAWPQECCGILLSAPEAPEVVSMVMPSRNVAPQQRDRRYKLDYKVQLRALELERSGVALVAGYYHSHPLAEPYFSTADIEHAVEDAVYVVVGGGRQSPRVRAWKMNGSGFLEEPLELVG